MSIKRTHDTVEFQIHSDLRALRHEGMTSFELDKLDEYARNITALLSVVHARRTLEDDAKYPPPVRGKWFRTLPPHGRCSYFDTRDKAIQRAESTSKNLSSDIHQASVAVEEWNALDHQDGLNQGWACFGFATNGTYGGPR